MLKLTVNIKIVVNGFSEISCLFIHSNNICIICIVGVYL